MRLKVAGSKTSLVDGYVQLILASGEWMVGGSVRIEVMMVVATEAVADVLLPSRGLPSSRITQFYNSMHNRVQLKYFISKVLSLIHTCTVC